MTRLERSAMEALTDDLLAALARSAPTKLDLTSPAQRESIEGMAVALAETADTLDGLREVAAAVAHDGALPMSVRVATKLALGRAMLEAIDEPVHVSVVIAVYKEHQRILTAKEHPVGEDFLREKLRQLRWLFRPTPRHDWDLTVVDDGCPEGSGEIARRILDEYAHPEEEVKVLFLEDAIRDGLPIVESLASTKESQKGGAIRLGMWHATRASRVGYHVVAFTDADLSTHLAQLGLLVRPLTEPEHHAAIGSRREARSVVVKASKRDARGRLFIYLWKRLIPQLRGIVDTQCGFKAFEADHLATWIEDVQESGFSFDVEMLVRLQLVSPGSAKKVALAWIDSEAASTTAELEPYLPMLKSIARLYRTVLPPTPSGERFATFIEGLDPDTFRRLAANVPKEIAARDPADFDDFAGVSPEQLRAAAAF